MKIIHLALQIRCTKMNNICREVPSFAIPFRKKAKKTLQSRCFNNAFFIFDAKFLKRRFFLFERAIL